MDIKSLALKSSAEKLAELSKDLEDVLNKHSIDSKTNTPDFILAEYLINCLTAYNAMIISKTLFLKDTDV